MKQITLASTLILAMSACNTNPLLRESSLEYGAPEFDKIKTTELRLALEYKGWMVSHAVGIDGMLGGEWRYNTTENI